MEYLYQEGECEICEVVKNCLVFPCRHLVCSKCYCDFYRMRVRGLKQLVQENVEQYCGKSTCLGCVYGCETALLSMDPSVLVELFREFADEESAGVVEELKSFFLGIPTYFFNCRFCTRLHVDFRRIKSCPVVENNFRAAFNETVLRFLDSYKVAPFGYELEEFLDVSVIEEGFSEYLLFLNETKSVQYYGHKAMKVCVENLKKHKYFALVKAKVLKDEKIWVHVHTQEDVVIRALFKIDSTKNATTLVAKEASNESRNIIKMLKEVNLSFKFSFVKNVDKQYAMNDFVNNQGKDFLLMINETFDVYWQHIENTVKMYKLNAKYAKVGVLFTFAKAIVIEESEDFISVEGFDMISYTKIYSLD